MIPVAEFWNLAGRAGRALEETEGHVIVVAENEAEARQLQRRYLDPSRVERVRSVLYRFFDAIARARLPGRGLAGVTTDTDLGEHPFGSSAYLDALDVQLLAIAAEEIVDTADEEAVTALLGETLCKVQLDRAAVPIEPLGRYLARRFAALRARVPDGAQRRSFYRTGLSLQGCEALLSAVDEILDDDPTILDPQRFADLRRRLLLAATTVAELKVSCEQYHVPPESIPPLAADWMDGATLVELRTRHGEALAARDPMEFSARLERIVIRDLPWILSAAVELIKLRKGEEWDSPLELSALPSMVKFGLATVGACYGASVGLRRRDIARTVGDAFAAQGGGSFAQFLSWLGALAPEEISSLVSSGDARLIADRIAILASTREAISLLANRGGEVRADLRGLAFHGRWSRVVRLPLPAPVVLEREASNPHDPSAVAVRTLDGEMLGYVAREVARAVSALLDGGLTADAQIISRVGNDPTRVGTASLRIRVSA